MKTFANWVMKGRMQAVIAATVLAVLALQRSVLMTAGGAAGAEFEEGKSETHTTDPDPVAPAVGRRV